MKPKLILTAVLIVIVVLGLVTAVLQVVRDNATTEKTASNERATTTQPADSKTKAAPKIIVYYFHRNRRCNTCRAIEKYTHQAVKKNFAKALASGRIEWKVINYELPVGQRFAKEFKLTTSSVIVAKIENGKTVEWKNLVDIWKLVRDKPEFLRYIKSEIDLLMEED